MKDILITGTYLSILVILLGRFNLSGNPDPYVMSGEVIGAAVGSILIPLFNGHLTKKYLDLLIVKKHQLLTMFIVGTISLMINYIIVFLVIVGAIGINKISNKNKVKNN